jgi:hypothetical protein
MFWNFYLYGRFETGRNETLRFETWRFINLTFGKPYVLKPDVLKPGILKPDVLKPDALWVYRHEGYLPFLSLFCTPLWQVEVLPLVASEEGGGGWSISYNSKKTKSVLDKSTF